jgi:addiction module RelB/DinJ family antitoxin
MSLITRSATIQVRVVPVVKKASEEVLWRIGLTMSEAVELFLRRVIVDERIPFDLIALEVGKVDFLSETALTGESAGFSERNTASLDQSRLTATGGAARKKSKKFLGAHTPTGIQARKSRKKVA